MTAFLIPLTQANDGIQTKDASQVWIWSGIAIGVVFLLVFAIAVIRKKYFPEEKPGIDSTPAGFGVSQLKDLYDQGLLTDDEFNAAKAKIVAESHAAFMGPKKGKLEKSKK